MGYTSDRTLEIIFANQGLVRALITVLPRVGCLRGEGSNLEPVNVFRREKAFSGPVFRGEFNGAKKIGIMPKLKFGTKYAKI